VLAVNNCLRSKQIDHNIDTIWLEVGPVDPARKVWDRHRHTQKKRLCLQFLRHWIPRNMSGAYGANWFHYLVVVSVTLKAVKLEPDVAKKLDLAPQPVGGLSVPSPRIRIIRWCTKLHAAWGFMRLLFQTYR